MSKEAELLEDAGILVTRHDGAIRLMRASTDKPMLTPLTELIRVTYGVPQIIGEEFGRVSGVVRIALTGTWAERFAGVTGPEPESIQVRLTVAEARAAEQRELMVAADRAQRRLSRAVHFTVTVRTPLTAGTRAAIPTQRTSSPPIVQVAPIAASAGEPPTVGAWPNGVDVITRLLDSHQLELFSGPATDSTPYFELATHHVSAAEDVKSAAAGSAFVLVCQAARLIGSGLLATQGLRPAAGSHDDVVGRSTTAQFGPQFGQIEQLRQRLLALSTPVGRDNRVTITDVDASVSAVRAMLKTANDVVAELSLFT